MGDARRCRVVNEAAGTEAIQCEWSIDGMRLTLRYSVREDMSRAWRGLESTGSPTAIDVEARNGGFAYDRRTIRRHVHHAAPVAQHAQSRKLRKQFADRIYRVRRDVQTALLAVGHVLIGARAYHKFAFIRLRYIGVNSVRQKHTREDRLHRFGDQCLQ